MAFGAVLDIPMLPPRPPRLCKGCPHRASVEVIRQAAAAIDPEPEHPSLLISADPGCYSFAAESEALFDASVCAGAAINIARGASEGGIPYALAVTGDSAFLHSGVSALLDAAASHKAMTVIILDNGCSGLSGGQSGVLRDFRPLILSLGVEPEHYLELETQESLIGENAEQLGREIAYRGLSVLLFRGACIKAAEAGLET
jgi:indolepyruvate ferredoxin oxidoreductase alpha subunit